MANPVGELRVYSHEEIELFLGGDRREVDRLLLHGMNNISAALIPHMTKEEAIFQSLGEVETIRRRSAWVDAQIAAAETRALFWEAMRTELGKHTLKALLVVLVALGTYYVNGHVTLK